MEKLMFKKGNTSAAFLASGDLYELNSHDIMINQMNGNPLDGSGVQLYLRIWSEKQIDSVPMIGSNSPSSLQIAKEGLIWKGTFQEVAYQVTFQLGENDLWFWTVQLKGTGQKVDVLYGQDLGNALKGAVQANEAYTSQYVDHKVNQTTTGYVITSRQNQPQNGKNPVVEQGSLAPTIGFSTDGYQFFGREYKLTNQPKVLTEKHLANEVYQYEFAYTALQTESFILNKKSECIFYGGVLPHLKTAVENPVFEEELVKQTYEKLEPLIDISTAAPQAKLIGEPITGQSFTEEEIERYFSNRRMEEVKAGQLLSFFTEYEHHVVLKEKETAMERAHGHIVLSGKDLSVDKPLLASTVYMYGIFNSQVVLGNTSMNKLLSNNRNSLNVMKYSGQRIYLKIEQEWQLLTMPSAFEMGLNSAKWFYKLEDDVVIVTTYTLADSREIRTEFVSQKGKTYTVAISQHLLMNDQELPAYTLEKEGAVMKITANDTSSIHQAYPELTYYLTLDQPYEIKDEAIFGLNQTGAFLQVLELKQVSNFTFRLQGNLDNQPYQSIETDYQQENEKYAAFIEELLHHFRLEHSTSEIERMNTLVRWYTHNMLVHYLSPHGLEQYGGAAWGTRDVSQGPAEFFLALNRPEIIKDILCKVYANQFEDDGNWPQWFMFDRYEKQKAHESHGDVIVWPMKVVADYLEKTNDYELLQVKIPYTERETYKKTAKSYSLMDHIKKEIDYIESHFLAGTYLSGYGDGDWDDTLQPYDDSFKKEMASSWTVALSYQVIKKLSKNLEAFDQEYAEHLNELSENMRKDFEKYCLSTNILPGFVHMTSPEKLELLIHPQDKRTGIQYRLLPMTRSMIAELLTPEQVEKHYEVITKYLQFPDGVHLMNRPASYRGGINQYFKRAEQAANFGREIGLQYVHAHIRFAEAMAKIGKNQETWQALQIINPILIQDQVPNAELRQSNAYFSSSDGDFKTRYEAQENFDTLREGKTQVKGGWRIYSSGPGIYLNQLLSSVLGIRETADALILDPILPTELNGLTMNYQLFGKQVTFIFHLGSKERRLLMNRQEMQFDEEKNPYRAGGMKVPADLVESLLQEENTIDIYI